jgi:hypothetical protein
MSEKKQSENRSTTKICELSPDSDSEELKILTNAPSYVCMDCGRSAASGEHLCRPEKMFSAW